MEEIDIEAAKSLDPEYLWPEHASSEGEEPVDELGEWLNTVQITWHRYIKD